MNTTPITNDPATQYKIEAAQAAAAFVQSGMKVGLGTGSTAIWATRRIAELLANGSLRDIAGFATSRATWDEANRLGIPDEHFDYDKFVQEEFGPRSPKPRGIHWVWWLTALLLVVMFLLFWLR